MTRFMTTIEEGLKTFLKIFFGNGKQKYPIG